MILEGPFQISLKNPRLWSLGTFLKIQLSSLGIPCKKSLINHDPPLEFP